MSSAVTGKIEQVAPHVEQPGGNNNTTLSGDGGGDGDGELEGPACLHTGSVYQHKEINCSVGTSSEAERE